MNIAQWIERNADFSPEKVALYFEGQSLTYMQLADAVEDTARMLKWTLGIGRGDRVALISYNRPEYLMVLFACARLGAILVPLNWRLAIPELCYILENASAKALILEQTFRDLIPPTQEALPHCQIVGLDFAVEADEDFETLLHSADGDSHNPHVSLESPLLIVYTSGTTGHPKGAVLTQHALQWNAINSIHMHDMTSQDHILTPLPFFHVGGLNNQTTPALHCGATITIHSRFHPDETLRAITADHNCPTLTCLVPATMQACIQSTLWAEADFSNLRIVLTGSTTVPQSLSDTFRQRGTCVLEMYGSTETAPIAIYQRPDSDFSKRGSTGLPGLHCQARVVDHDGKDVPDGESGEILLKGPNIMIEYWGNQTETDATLRDGWYHSGDIGYRDEDGYYYITDRKKNMIISGGENIYPAEVERVLYEHPGIQDVAVIGQTDAQWGEVPVAVIVAKETNILTSDDLQAFIAGKLARFKIPKTYLFVDELPRNAMGKIQHFKVKAMFS
ncbi:MAG: long-chain-fatty-acid--CoA ligase [Chloroflexota bacterium]